MFFSFMSSSGNVYYYNPLIWNYFFNLFDSNKQFAVVENPGFWNWTFTLKDDGENVLAEINRDWRGIGLEVLSFSLLEN